MKDCRTRTLSPLAGPSVHLVTGNLSEAGTLRLRRSLGAFVCVSLSLASPGSTPNTRAAAADDLENTRIAIEGLPGTKNRFGIVVYSGRGRKLAEIGGSGEKSGSLAVSESWFQPDVDPSNRRIAAIHCMSFSWKYREGNSPPPECRLSIIDLHSREEHPVYVPPNAAWMAIPVWSPQGDRIAFLENRDVVVWSDGGTVRIPDVVEHARAAFLTGDSRLGWSDEGLYVYGEVPGREGGRSFVPNADIGRVDLVQRAVAWLGVGDVYFMYGKFIGKGMVLEESRGWRSGKKVMPDIPAVTALFASAEHPVFRPMWSHDRMRYFYVTEREGLFSATWIEGYDPATRDVFRVKTLDRAFYSE